MNLEFKRCFLCKGNSLQIKYFYHNQNINSESNEYFDKKIIYIHVKNVKLVIVMTFLQKI